MIILQRLVFVLPCFLFAGPIYSQGPLSPTSGPAPSMKTLDQVEPRIPVPGGGTPFVIKDPGSYYLTGNLSAGISIQSPDVTLDLMGFAIQTASGDAITIETGHQNVRVHNGSLSASSDGVFGKSSTGQPNVLEHLRVHDCGTAGIRATSGWIVRHCTITDNPGIGLRLSGSDNLVSDNIVKANGANYDFGTNNKLNLLLCEIPLDIQWPCRITLAGSLELPLPVAGTNGITVRADNVLIDLNGHGLIGQGPGTSPFGILLADGADSVHIRNGTIMNWEKGIEYEGSIYKNVRVENVTAKSNVDGFHLPRGSLITHSIAKDNSDNGFDLNHSRIESCIAVSNRYGIGAAHCTIIDASVMNNAMSGMRITQCLLENNQALQNGEHGFQITEHSRLLNCLAQGNETNGFHLIGANNEFDKCRAVINGDVGFYSPTHLNFFHGNVAINNFANDYFLHFLTNAHVTNTPIGASAWDNLEY